MTLLGRPRDYGEAHRGRDMDEACDVMATHIGRAKRMKATADEIMGAIHR